MVLNVTTTFSTVFIYILYKYGAGNNALDTY